MKLNVGVDGVRLSDSTNIMDVKVPDEMRVKHRSTIGWINDAFDGGFNATSVTMLTGNPGAGKTTLVMQFADALSAAGHTVLYNSYEESILQVKMKFENLGLKTGFVVSQHRKAKDLLAHADRMKKGTAPVFLFQDSLPTLDDGFYKDGTMNGRTPERAATMLTEWAKRGKDIVFFINHVNKSGQFAGKQAVKHCIDAHAHLSIEKRTGLRRFVVEKNRFGANQDTFVVAMGRTGIELVRRVAPEGDGLDGGNEDNVVEMEGARPPRRARRVRLG